MADSEIELHPKVMWIDLPVEGAQTLRSAGYNVTTGTYGQPYEVSSRSFGGRDDRLYHNLHLPNFAEQEVLFLSNGRRARGTRGGPRDSWRSEGQWANPRHRAMLLHRDDANRIRGHGGVFVIFAAAAPDVGYKDEGGHAEILDNWQFISLPEIGFHVELDEGREISSSTSPLGRLLGKHLEGAKFSCRFRVAPYLNFRVAAVSKYGEPVAGELFTGEELTVFLPEVQDPGELALDLLQSYLPEVTPRLFPGVRSPSWVEQHPYEMPEVTRLKDEVNRVRAAADSQVRALTDEIAQVRAKYTHYETLLNGTGGELVEAVAKALVELGLDNVVDADKHSEEDLREDLQVSSASGIILVEVKGINGAPSDDDALASGKYVAPRMREWGRTDVTALTIINHERTKPALQRTSNPFRPLVIESAQRHGTGLLTTWDLYRLLRGKREHGWRPEHVTPLFYHAGRIEAIPSHYEYIGRVQAYFPSLQVVGIAIENGALTVQDRVAFELSVDYLEHDVESMQLNKRDVQSAAAGQHVAIKTSLRKEDARDGVRVFRVRG